MTSPNWPKQFRAAASTFDWPALAQLAAEYATHLYAVPKRPTASARSSWSSGSPGGTRSSSSSPTPPLRTGPTPRGPSALRAGSRGRRHPAVALRLFTRLAADETASRVDRIEARGGIGRCYKEMFLACTEPDRRRRFLSRSLEATWPRIWRNGLLHLARDQRRFPPGPRTRRHPAPVGIAEGPHCRRHPADRRLGPVRNTWTEVTACEAAIALGRYDEAVERGEAFIETTPEMFTVAAFLRQLQKVWQLDTTTSPGDDLLPVLRSALLTVNGGQVTVASRPPRRTPRRRVRRRTAGGDPRSRPIPVGLVPHGAEALPGGGPHPDGRRPRRRHRVPRRGPRPAPGPTATRGRHQRSRRSRGPRPRPSARGVPRPR